MRKTSGLLGAAAVAAGLALAGCAGMPASGGQSTAQLLDAAGFQMRVADSAAQQTALQALPQRQVVRAARQGKARYLYADAGNQLLFMGDDNAYQRYRQLLQEERLEAERRRAAETREAERMEWEMWGPDPWD